MKRHRPLIFGLLASALLFHCKEPDTKPTFAKSGDLKPSTPEKDPNKPGSPTNPENPTPPIKGGADPELTRETLAKIMQAPGGEQDNACVGKGVESKQQIRLLTRAEYMNTLKVILLVKADYTEALPTEVIVFGFNNNADTAQISSDSSSAYLKVALLIAAEVKTNLAAIAKCSEADGAACGQKVIDTLAPLLWRRPLEAAEKTTLLKVYNTDLATTPADRMTVLLSTLLVAPDFLYRMEIGKNAALTSYELASALSYFFWGTSPDEELRAAAAAGTLSKSDTLLAQANRLLANSARSKFVTKSFVEGWLDPNAILSDEKDETAFPKLTAAIKADMAKEAVSTFDFYMKDPTSTFDTLFNADFSIGSTKLATYYGGQFESTTSKIKFVNQTRKGILGLGSFLAHNATPTGTHPIMRGVSILSNFLCNIPLPVPDDADLTVPTPSKSQTTRDSFDAIESNPACGVCHVAIDGIGLGLEDYDGGGIYREKENNKKIDLSGKLVGIDNATTKFTGTSELASYLGSSSQAKRCFVVEWYRFAHGYAERPDDVCAIRDLANKFEKGSLTLPQLLINIVTHPSYSKKD